MRPVRRAVDRAREHRRPWTRRRRGRSATASTFSPLEAQSSATPSSEAASSLGRTLEDDLRRPLDVQARPALLLVDEGHPLPHRIEGQLAYEAPVLEQDRGVSPRSRAASASAASTGSPTARSSSSSPMNRAVEARAAAARRARLVRARARLRPGGAGSRVTCPSCRKRSRSRCRASRRRSAGERWRLVPPSRAPSARAIVTVARQSLRHRGHGDGDSDQERLLEHDPRTSIAPLSASVMTTPKATIRRVSAPTRR